MRSQRNRAAFCGSFVAAAVFGLSALAGPVRDFERDLSRAYGHYRAALLNSNQSNKPGTESAIAAFDEAWSKQIALRRETPPPHYADDPRWTETLDKVGAVIAKSKREVQGGDLAKAHVTLEEIRDLIGDLRLRNGTISYSDRVNSYHEQMEHVVQRTYAANADGVAMLREDVAVLAFLAAELEKFKPVDLAADEPFKQALGTLKSSVDALQAAVRSGGDAAQVGALKKALKPAYSKFFIKYG